jgi:hypothetical protein
MVWNFKERFIIVQLMNKFALFMESVSYLLCSQKPITEPVDSNPNQHPNSLISVLISFHLCVSHRNLSSTSHVFRISTYDFFMPHPHQYYLISVTVLSEVGRSR